MSFLKKVIWKYLPDKYALKRIFFHQLWYTLNLKNPQTFNEKLQRLKLYNRKPEYTKMVDKYLSKQYVASIIWEEYIIPTLWIYNSFDEIDIDKLPNQFVVKCTHDSGTVVICKDKKSFDLQNAKHKIDEHLKIDYYNIRRERPYKNVKPRVIVEKYMEDYKSKDLQDYKFMCFNWKVKCSFVCSERFNKWLKVTFFDKNWNVMPFERHYPKSLKKIKKPKNYDKMVYISEKLSKNIPFIRIDLYEINWKIYFWELTFFPWAWIEEFTPKEWDYKLGSRIKLPNKKNN